MQCRSIRYVHDSTREKSAHVSLIHCGEKLRGLYEEHCILCTVLGGALKRRRARRQRMSLSIWQSASAATLDWVVREMSAEKRQEDMVCMTSSGRRIPATVLCYLTSQRQKRYGHAQDARHH